MVGQPHLVNPMIPRDIEIKPFGAMLQLASSMSRANLALMEDLVDEMIRGSGRQINNLDGHARQLADGIKMAMNELRAVKRVCTKEIDYIMVLMPTSLSHGTQFLRPSIAMICCKLWFCLRMPCASLS